MTWSCHAPLPKGEEKGGLKAGGCRIKDGDSQIQSERNPRFPAVDMIVRPNGSSYREYPMLSETEFRRASCKLEILALLTA